MGYRQADFAAIGGVELPSQSRYETAKQRPKIDYLLAITAAGADAQFILTGKRSGGDALTAEEASVLDNYRTASSSTKAAIAHLLAVSSGSKDAGPLISRLPSEDALARMFQAMLLPLDLGDALEETARTFAQQLPASLDAAGPGRPPQDPTPTPVPDKPSPKPATPRRAS